MLRFFSRSKTAREAFDFSLLKADMHSHLIPGIDDGAPDLETSLQLIRGMSELGYTKLVTTPHIMWDMYKNTRDDILYRLDEVRAAVKEEGLDVDLQAGAEYFLDDHVSGLIQKKEPLLTISANMVLVEFSMALPPMGLKDILFEMQMNDYVPVIAHPERYIYLEGQKEFYDELRDIGCLFQLNILSLSTYYGKAVHNLAQYLIKKEYYELLGTDLHHPRHLEALQQSSLIDPVKKLLASGKLRNHLL
jgi:tyrosine-protein phosphatase YwqE